MGRDIQNHLLFEVATEVANKVGGIYSVLKSKAPITVAEYRERYTLLGPLNYNSAQMEVEELPVKDPKIMATLKSMSDRGVRWLYGRWLIEGAPRVLLFDIHSAAQNLDEWKADLWNGSGIPTPDHDLESNDAILLGYLVAWFLGELVYNDRERAVICHCHEWLAGVALPLCRKRRLDVTTIFTTHATLLGRYLCAGSTDFYNNLAYFDVDAEAGKRGIYHRYCIERSAAHSADVFTTVSDITALESEHLLKRKPDGVLPNGLNVVKFQAVHEFQNLHAMKKEKINEFVKGHFYGNYDFDLDNTLYFFIAGRYEFRNKGCDFFIESLARLNHKLKESGSKMTVVAFIIMPGKTSSYTVDTLKGQAVIKQLEGTIEEVQKKVGERLFEHCARFPNTHNASNTGGNEVPSIDELIKPADRVLLKRRIFALKRDGLPPIVTHNMLDDANDPVLSHIRRVQLFNKPEDRVKIIFHPEFLNANNPILSIDYDEFVRGCHLGVFPSYYEPWGYTPAECTVMGVPSVTTNLSGFGCYMEDLIENTDDYGIYIVDRKMKAIDESINQLTDQMFEFTQKTRRQRINQRNRTERLSDLLDWKRMGLEYIKARQLALKRAYPDKFKNGSNPFQQNNSNVKLTRPLSVPGSPRGKVGLMTPGDLGSLQDAQQGLATDDYIGFKLGAHQNDDGDDANEDSSYPLTLRGTSAPPQED